MAQQSDDVTSGGRRLIGRHAELAMLRDLLPTSVDDHGTSVTLTGPGGIGKTRLASEMADHAEAAGATVVWGRCSEEAHGTPFWPWVQIVRRLRDETTGNDLARLVLGGPAEGDRLELFEAAANVLEDAAGSSPLLVIVDDAHLADASSLLLTQFLCRRLRESAVAIVITHRHADGLDGDQADRLRDLDDLTVSVAVNGLEPEAIEAVLPSGLVLSDVLAATGGNPLLLRHAIGSATMLANPSARLGDILEQRIASVSADVRELISTLAVVGSGWTHAELASIIGVDVVDLDRTLDRAATTDMVRADDGLIHLSHALVSQAGGGSVTEKHRHVLHARAARCLAVSGNETERATHLLRSGPEFALDALDAVERVSADALRALAAESAGSLVREALDFLDGELGAALDPQIAQLRRLDLLLLLGQAMWRTGQREQSFAAFDAAWDLAADVGTDMHRALAALRGGIQYDFHGDRTTVVSQRLRAALRAFDDDTEPIRALLLATLAMKMMAIDPDMAREYAIDAVKAAETSADPIASGYAMVADQITLLGPATLNRRVQTAHQILAIAHDHNHPDLLLQGRFLLLGALLERGDIRALDAELATQERTLGAVADETQVRHSLWFRCTRALLRGSIEDAEQLAEECFAVAMQLGDPDGIGVYGGHITVIRWMQGRMLETEQLYVDLQAEEPDDPLWPAVLAFMWLTHGRLDAARGAIDSLPALDTIEEGQHWLLTMVGFAEAAVVVGTDAHRREVREMLLPYADRVVPVAMGASLWGTVSRPLGLLAQALGELDEAIEHFQRAVSLTARLGAWPWLIEAQLDLAMALAERDAGDADRSEIDRLVAEAGSAAQRLGLDHFVARAAAMSAASARPLDERRSAATPVGEPGEAEMHDDDRAHVTVCGGFEVVLPDGSVAQWPSRKSRLLLRVLIAQRGRSIHRESLAAELWPDDLGAVGRLDVEVSRLRRALDPARVHDRDEFVVVRDGTVRLQVERFDIDVENIITAAAALAAGSSPLPTEMLSSLCGRYSGAAFAEDAYADWAQPVRDATASAICSLFRELARRQVDADNHVAATTSLRAILAIDEFDIEAHRALITALRRSGSHGLAAQATARYQASMAELGVEATALDA